MICLLTLVKSSLLLILLVEIVFAVLLKFSEKSQTSEGWINGGFFVFEPRVVDYIWTNDDPLETGALPRLVKESQLMAFEHGDFWQPMDTLREKIDLSNFAKQLPPPWLKI